MDRVLVTGAGGFVGRAAVAALRAAGHKVHGVARSPTAGVEVTAWHTADLRDPAAVAELVRAAGASHLLHLAWTTAHGRFWSDPANRDWARATIHLVQSFAQAGGVRAVIVGSCAQYDWDALGDSGVASEDSTPRCPATLYGQAKQWTEDQLSEWASAAGLSFATGLLFFPYGPYDKPERLVPSVTRSLLAGDVARVSAGTQVRDFIYIDDCGGALAGLIHSSVTGAVNVGSGRGASVAEVAETVARIVGREDLLRIGALPAVDEAPAVVADTGRLTGEVGFNPALDLETGLRATVEWLSAHPAEVAAG